MAGTIRILWSGSTAASVTIRTTGGSASQEFTVNGSPVTFPYSLTEDTSFVTTAQQRFTVSVIAHGAEIANTPDGTRVAELTGSGATLTFAPGFDDALSAAEAVMSGAATAAQGALADTAIQPPDADGWPISIDGDSFGLTAGAFFAPGDHYVEQLADRLSAGTITSYAQGGRRIFEAACATISGTAFPGATAPVAGASSLRNGLTVVDSLMNTFAHGPTSANAPAVLNANNRYRDSVAAALRTLLALDSSASRIEESAFVTPTDAWTQSSGTYWSGGASYNTTVVGRRISYSVTPPQRGALAGKVFLLAYRIDPASGLTTGDVTVAIDDGTPVATPVGQWEQYTGNSGATVLYCPHVIPVTLPVDGAAHKVTLAHAGTAGHLVVTDGVIVPSETPSVIAVMEPPAPVANAGGWTAGQVATWKANAATLLPAVRAVVAEFPNAIWVPTTITPNGMYSGDGRHPNGRGQRQRRVDAETALTDAVRAMLASRVLENAPDGDFGVI